MSQKIGTLRLALTFAGGFWGSCSRSRCSAAPECCSCG